MLDRKFNFTTFFFCTGLLALSACRNEDLYSQLPAECFEPILPADVYHPLRSKPECQSAIEAMVTFDSSFGETDVADITKINFTEALFALAVYPVGLPADPTQISLFNTISVPFQSGILCNWFASLYPNQCPTFSGGTDPNTNRHLFNQTVQMSREVRLSDSTTTRYYATHGGVYNYLELTPLFSSGTFSPAVRAHMLIHETTHGMGILHSRCGAYSPDSEGDNDCDDHWNGAYAAGALYLQAVLNGSRDLYLQPFEVREIHRWLCSIATSRIEERSPEMQTFYEEHFLKLDFTEPNQWDCGPTRVSITWSMAH